MVSLDVALARLSRYHQARGSSPQTVTGYTLAVRKLQRDVLDGYRLGDLDHATPAMVAEWMGLMRGAGHSPASVKTRVRNVKIVTAWAAREGLLDADPLASFAVPRAPEAAKATLAPADVDALLRTCRRTFAGVRDRAIMVCLYSTGLRAGEIIGLEVADWDATAGLLTVRRGKGGKWRHVPVGDPLDRELTRYVERRGRQPGALWLTDERRPLTQAGLRQLLRRRADEAGVTANPHKWRHSAAVAYLRAGGRLEHLRLLLGHSDYQQTLRYARLAGVDVAVAHQSADPARLLRAR